MNHIYKVIWNKAKHAYVVTSEVAKSHTKGTSAKAVKTALAAAVGMSLLMGGYTANAAPATNPAGTGDGVAVGAGSSAPKAENVAIGKGATISYSNGPSAATGDIVVGSGAKTNNYVSQGGGIAIGQNAFSENMAGTQERSFNFGQTTFTGSGFLGLQSPFIPADPTKVVTGIAVGQNTYARTGSVMIGTHNFKGKLYDTDVDTASEANMRSNNVIVNATTLGTNSFNNAAFGVVTGAYSAITGAYDGGTFSSKGSQNFGATITGSLNSIESKTASSNDSGIANSIVGVANRTFNSNGALVFGAGNEITNSVSRLSAPTSSGDSVQDLQKTLMKAVRNSNGGGATLAIGGGNIADYTQASQMIGVNNTLKGTAANKATYSLLNGYKNEATNVEHVSVIGSENVVNNTKNAIVLGDKRKLTGANGNIILGSSDTIMETKVVDAAILGHNANVTVAGGVALGAESVATTDKDMVGYDPSTKAASAETSATWKSTAAAVSVGDAANNITRQITNVAAGKEDTDAVNVAQLKVLGTKVENGGVHYYSVNDDGHQQGNYRNDGAMAANSTVAGIGSASTDGSGSAVFGNNSSIRGKKNDRNESIVVGNNLSVNGVQNAVFGTSYDNYDKKETRVKGDNNTVLGVGNLVGWTAEQDTVDQTKWNYTELDGSDQNVAVGLTNTVNGGSVVVGTSSVSDSLGTSIGHANTIIGMSADGGQHGLALGNNLMVKGEAATAVGYKAEAKADAAIAMGHTAKAEGVSDIAVGQEANAKGNWSVAVGVGAIAEKEAGLALGMGANAKAAYGVALGAYSVADRKAFVPGYDPATNEASTNTGNVWMATVGAISVGDKAAGYTRQITNVAAGSEDTDAVNVAQLKKLQNAVSGAKLTLKKGDNVTITSDPTDANTLTISAKDTTLKADTNALKLEGKKLSLSVEDTSGKKVTGSVDLTAVAGQIDTRSTVKAGENVEITKDDNTFGAKEYTINVKADGKVESGNTGIVSGDTVYNETHVKNDGTYVKKDNSVGDNLSVLDKQVNQNATNITNLQNDITNVTNGVNKGLDFAGDKGTTNRKMGEKLTVTGGATGELTEGNIGVEAKDGTLTLKLAKDIKGLDNVEAKTFKAGDTTINNEGMTINNGPTITKNKVDMHNIAINNVGDGKVEEGSKDAINGGQVYNIQKNLKNEINNNTQNIYNMNNAVGELGERINKVGAGAAALAALHPSDFNPDDKWSFAVGYGNYKSADALAVGTFYRPSEDVMISFGSSFGGGENMVNAGLSFKLGQTNSVSRSKVSMAKDLIDLSQRVAKLEHENKELLDVVRKLTGNPGELKDINFPDVPKDHWAYTYVKTLADRGYLVGYPDGEFKGDRPMTRYEYAAIIYRALQNGAPLDGTMAQSMEEFKPELTKVAEADRFRVERIRGEDNDRKKIERVRVNDENQENVFRDMYGTVIEATAESK